MIGCLYIPAFHMRHYWSVDVKRFWNSKPQKSNHLKSIFVAILLEVCFSDWFIKPLYGEHYPLSGAYRLMHS